MKDPSAETGGLKEYKARRNFRRTAEPKPRVSKRSEAKPLAFVIQKHDASRLHYDFRLEMDGVLKSWAVPKGLPTKRGDRRLAIQVEDHPIDYANFEGTIPHGNYGAGTVMVWDAGTYAVHGIGPLQALKEGKIHLTLAGDKLKGDWALIRLKSRLPKDKPGWLVFKTGEDDKPRSAKRDDESFLTHRSMKEIAAANDAQWSSDRPAKSRETARRGVSHKKTRRVDPCDQGRAQSIDQPRDLVQR